MNKVVVYLQDNLIMIECRYSHCCNINAGCFMFILLGRKLTDEGGNELTLRNILQAIFNMF